MFFIGLSWCYFGVFHRVIVWLSCGFPWGYCGVIMGFAWGYWWVFLWVIVWLFCGFPLGYCGVVVGLFWGGRCVHRVGYAWVRLHLLAVLYDLFVLLYICIYKYI